MPQSERRRECARWQRPARQSRECSGGIASGAWGVGHAVLTRALRVDAGQSGSESPLRVPPRPESGDNDTLCVLPHRHIL